MRLTSTSCMWKKLIRLHHYYWVFHQGWHARKLVWSISRKIGVKMKRWVRKGSWLWAAGGAQAQIVNSFIAGKYKEQERETVGAAWGGKDIEVQHRQERPRGDQPAGAVLHPAGAGAVQDLHEDQGVAPHSEQAGGGETAAEPPAAGGLDTAQICLVTRHCRTC